MRSLLIALTVALVIAPFACGNAVAADQVSDEMLTQMGLTSMQTLSDVQGEQIRGKCFVPRPIVANIVAVNRSRNATVDTVQSIRLNGCCRGVTVNGVAVNRSRGAYVVGTQSITRRRSCCGGVAVNGIVVNRSPGAYVYATQSIRF